MANCRKHTVQGAERLTRSAQITNGTCTGSRATVANRTPSAGQGAPRAILIWAGRPAVNRAAAASPPSRRVRGAATAAATASSAAPDRYVQVRALPGNAVGTIRSYGFG